MSLNKFFDFMQVLNTVGKHTTKNEYFSNHFLFYTIYLLQEKKLNSKNYSEQEIIMRSFVQATEHDVHMYAKFVDFYPFWSFVIKYSKI
jgi:hypothetical protein